MLSLTPEQETIVMRSIREELSSLIASDGRVPNNDQDMIVDRGMKYLPRHRSLQSFSKMLVEDYLGIE